MVVEVYPFGPRNKIIAMDALDFKETLNRLYSLTILAKLLCNIYTVFRHFTVFSLNILAWLFIIKS